MVTPDEAYQGGEHVGLFTGALKRAIRATPPESEKNRDVSRILVQSDEDTYHQQIGQKDYPSTPHNPAEEYDLMVETKGEMMSGENGDENIKRLIEAAADELMNA
jgi:hypothetical protein